MNSMDSNSEEPHSQESHFLHISRPMWFVITVVLGVTFLGKLTDRFTETDHSERSDLVFGNASAPSISRLTESDILDIPSCSGARFYSMRRANVGDQQVSDEIWFVDASQQTTGWIRRDRAASENWQPVRDEFDDVVLSLNALHEGVLGRSKRQYIVIDGPDDSETSESKVYKLDQLITPLGRPIQMTEIEYEDQDDSGTDSKLPQINRPKLVVRWAHPARSAAWPVRVHLGRCTLGDQTLLIGIQQWAAKTASVDYRSGIFASIAQAIGASR